MLWRLEKQEDMFYLDIYCLIIFVSISLQQLNISTNKTILVL